MTGSIEIPFEIGAKVWHARYEHEKRHEECPDCAGTKVLKFILGNGETHTLDCATCSSGYNPPKGYVEVTRIVCEPTEVVLRRLIGYPPKPTYSSTPEGASTYIILKVCDLFESKEACEKACEVKRAEGQARDDEQHIARLASKRQDMAWSVHYWRRQLSERRKDVARIEARLDVCKTKAKEPHAR